MPDGRIPFFRPRRLGKPQKLQRKAYERQPERSEDRKYYQGKTWRQVRAQKLDLNPCCEECERLGIATLAAQVHHVQERKDFPDLALDLDNLESLCLPCHNAKRAKRAEGPDPPR